MNYPSCPFALRSRHQRGFTLVELLVTIVIIAILATLGVPSFTQFLRNWQRDSATKAFMTHVQLARTEAIKTSRKVVMCTSANGTSCASGAGSTNWKQGWVVFVDADSDDDLDTSKGDRILAVRSGSAGIASMTSSDNKPLKFLSNGLMGSNATTVTVTPSGSSGLKLNKIAISRVGRTSLSTEDQS